MNTRVIWEQKVRQFYSNSVIGCARENMARRDRAEEGRDNLDRLIDLVTVEEGFHVETLLQMIGKIRDSERACQCLAFLLYASFLVGFKCGDGEVSRERHWKSFRRLITERAVLEKRKKASEPNSTSSLIAAEIEKQPDAPAKEILRGYDAACKKIHREPVSKSTFYEHFNRIKVSPTLSKPEKKMSDIEQTGNLARGD